MKIAYINEKNKLKAFFEYFIGNIPRMSMFRIAGDHQVIVRVYWSFAAQVVEPAPPPDLVRFAADPVLGVLEAGYYQQGTPTASPSSHYWTT